MVFGFTLGGTKEFIRPALILKHTTLLYALYSSGMRLNEILNLRIDDLW